MRRSPKSAGQRWFHPCTEDAHPIIVPAPFLDNLATRRNDFRVCEHSSFCIIARRTCHDAEPLRSVCEISGPSPLCYCDVLACPGYNSVSRMKALLYGDNLQILRERIDTESVDLIYLDPPFNSQASYNVLFKTPTGEQSKAQ